MNEDSNPRNVSGRNEGDFRRSTAMACEYNSKKEDGLWYCERSLLRFGKRKSKCPKSKQCYIELTDDWFNEMCDRLGFDRTTRRVLWRMRGMVTGLPD